MPWRLHARHPFFPGYPLPSPRPNRPSSSELPWHQLFFPPPGAGFNLGFLPSRLNSLFPLRFPVNRDPVAVFIFLDSLESPHFGGRRIFRRTRTQVFGFLPLPTCLYLLLSFSPMLNYTFVSAIDYSRLHRCWFLYTLVGIC